MHVHFIAAIDGPSVESCDTPAPECPALPIADKRISLEKSRALLRSASYKAVSEVTGAKSPQKYDVDQLSAVNFPFENAIFEGGGVKGIAYVGAIKVSLQVVMWWSIQVVNLFTDSSASFFAFQYLFITFPH